jgi:hypothetical protein
MVAQYGSGAWSARATAPVGWPRGPQAGEAAGAGYLGWTLVVVTGDPAAPPGQVMVLDGARPVDAARPGFSVPLGGLLTGQVVRVHAVDWTVRGPRFSAFAQPFVRPPDGKLPRRERPLPNRRNHRRCPLSPARAPSTHHAAQHSRPSTPRARTGWPGPMRAIPIRAIPMLGVAVRAIPAWRPREHHPMPAARENRSA